MNKFLIYVGCNVNGKQTTPTDIYEQNVTKECLKFFNGFTVTRGRGVWMGEVENTVIIEILNDCEQVDTKVLTLCEHLKRVFNQECILMTSEQVNVNFI